MSVGLKKFEECIEKVTYGNKIQRTEYLDNGKFPVVSQESKLINGFWNNEEDLFDVILVEVKRNGIFDKEEKEKAKWYLQNKIVKEILIAMEERNGRKLEVKYINFLEKYPKCLI